MLPVKDFVTLKKYLKKDTSDFKKIRLALLGDSATQFLAVAIQACGIAEQLDLQIWEAEFNQVDRQVLDPGSELYTFQPEIIVIFKSSHKLLSRYNKLGPGAGADLAQQEMDLVNRLISQINSNLDCKIFYYNYAEINDAVFGNFANKMPVSFPFQLRKLNYELMNLSVIEKNFYLVDLSSIQNSLGKAAVYNPAIYINSDMVLSIDSLPQIAGMTTDLVLALEGKIKKCVILDLDNTLWGGVIGDDGLENIQLGNLGIGKAFTEFQYWLKKLKNRGIILAVCSKNTEAVAMEPFEKHPDMVLKLEDIAVFIANWESKVDNIRHIRKVLNIGFDSMVFLDDNPFERNIVREKLPELTVPELPEDPALYLEYLYSLNLFETVSFSGEDQQRTDLYRLEAKRLEAHQEFTTEDDFLESLQMVSLIKSFNKFNIPRVAQLTQRSNQFNLTTIRYNEAEIEALAKNDDIISLTFTLEDKFGDNGLICVVILKNQNSDTLFIDTWLMSCRVLKRGMENFVLNTIVELNKDSGIKFLKGQYIPTAKNAMVTNHYSDLGFAPSGEFWILDTENYQPKKTFIKKK